MCVTYCADGTAQELPYQYVPSAFREWDQVPEDWPHALQHVKSASKSHVHAAEACVCLIC